MRVGVSQHDALSVDGMTSQLESVSRHGSVSRHESVSRHGSLYSRRQSLASRVSTRMEDVIDKMDTGKSQQVGRMILVIMLPVLAVVAKASILFEQGLSTYRETSHLYMSLTHTIATSTGIHLIQVERGLSAVVISDQSSDITNYQTLTRARLETNDFLYTYSLTESLTLRSSGEQLKSGIDILGYVEGIRYMVDNHGNVTVSDMVDLYTDLSSSLYDHTVRTNSVPSLHLIWPLVVSYTALTRAIDVVGVQRALGGAALAACYMDRQSRETFTKTEAEIDTYLGIATRYFPAFSQSFTEKLASHDDMLAEIAKLRELIMDPERLGRECESGRDWFSLLTQYIEVLVNLEQLITGTLDERLRRVADEAQRWMAAYMTVMILTTLICLTLCVWYSLKLSVLLGKMKQHGIHIKEKSEAVREEKKKTDFLLYQMMPQKMADQLKYGLDVHPDSSDSVTVYFSDIMDWVPLTAKLSPHQCVTLLNQLYKSFDGVIVKYDVYKVETVSDSYMCVSGLPEPNDQRHVIIISQMSLEMIELAKTFTIQDLPGRTLNLRIGFHSGPCVAGIIGTKMPRYCLFGDTVNTASRMQSTGQAMRIHVSPSSKKLMDDTGGFTTEARGKIFIKGKGDMDTYWLLSYKKSKRKDTQPSKD